MSLGATGTLMNLYPGMRPFRPDEVEFFFGRDGQVDAMVDKLAAQGFLVVAGPSGCGKSSLVSCGLIPALLMGRMVSAGSAWRVAMLRPRGAPVDALATALAEPGVLFDAQTDSAEGPGAAEIVGASLRMSTRGLVDVVERAAFPPDTQMLVVVDQFEELFRGPTDADADEAAAFVRLLLEATKELNGPVHVVVTLRADFLGECTRFAGLVDAVNAGLHLVSRLTREERREVILGPASLAGATFSPVLVTRLVNDANESLDELTRLQHVLNRTWAYWESTEVGRGAPLEFKHYEAIGGLEGALDRHAEHAFLQLDPSLQPVWERLFKALTDRAGDPRGVRRPRTLGQLCDETQAPSDGLIAVIDAFRRPGRAFLVPAIEVPLGQETVVDLAHESLMRAWRRLQHWVDEEAASAALFRWLAELAESHAQGTAGLLRGADLERARFWRERNQPFEVWARRYHPGWTAAMDFLEASLAANQAANRADVRLLEHTWRHRAMRAAGMALLLLVGADIAYRLLTQTWPRLRG